MYLRLSMSGQAKTEGGNTHLNIAGMPETAQTSAEGVPEHSRKGGRRKHIAEVPESAQASIPGSRAELIDSYDPCAILVDKRPSGALSVL